MLRPFTNFSKKALLEVTNGTQVLEGIWNGRSFKCVDETIKDWFG